MDNNFDIVMRLRPELAPGAEQARAQFQNAMNAMSSATAPVQAQLKATEQNIKDLAKAIQDNKLQPASAAYQQFATQLAAAEKQAATLRAQLGQHAQALKTTEQATTSATSAVKANTDAQVSNEAALQRSIQRHQEMAAGLRTAGDLLTVAVSAPLVAAGAAAIHFAVGFETEMTKVVTLAGASSAEIGRVRQAVLDLAPATGVAPAELAKGLFVLESYGLRGAAAMDTLTIAAKMSALGMGETSETARALTGVLFAYKNQNLSAADAGDILTKTVQLGNMKIGELIPALAKVGPIAAAMGVSFQDVAASVATFTHAGVDASLAATGMRAVLNSILTDSAKTEKGFKALAAAAHDNTISMANFRQEMTDKGLTAAMLHLMDSVEKAGDAGVKAFGAIIPNIRGLTEALAVYKANGGMVADLLEQINHAHGTLATSTAELKKTAAQMWAEIRAQMEVVFIALGDKLLPKLKEMVPAIQNLLDHVLSALDAFSKLPKPVQTFTEAVIGIGVLSGPLLSGLGRLATAWTTIERAIWGAVAAENTFAGSAVLGKILALLGGSAAVGDALLLGGAGAMATVGAMEAITGGRADELAGDIQKALTPRASVPSSLNAYVTHPVNIPLSGGFDPRDRNTIDPALLRQTPAALTDDEQKKAAAALKQYAAAWQKTEDEIQKIWGEAFVAEQKIDKDSLTSHLAVLEQQRQNDLNAAATRIAETTKSADQYHQLEFAINAKYAALERDAAIAALKKIEDSKSEYSLAAIEKMGAAQMKASQKEFEAESKAIGGTQKLQAAAVEATLFGVDKEIAGIERRRDAEILAAKQSGEVTGLFKAEEIKAYQDAAEKEIAALRAVGRIQVEEVFHKAAMEADRVPPKIDRMTQSTHLLTKAFSELGQTIGGTFGAILTGASQFSGLLANFQDARDKYANAKAAYENGTGTLKAQQDAQYAYGQSKSAAISGGIGIGLGLVAQNIDTSGQASTHGIIAHYAAEGAAAGAPYAVPTYGASIGVGAGVGALYGWYESGKEWRRVAQDLARDFGGIKVSDDFAKAIEDLENETGLQRIQALTTQLDKLVEQAGGLRPDNLDMFTGKLRDAFVFLQQHTLTLAQTTQILDKNFANFAAAATDKMGRLGDKMREIIQLDQALGTHSQAIADYLKGQGETALGSLGGIMENVDSDQLDAIKKRLDDAQAAMDAANKAILDDHGRPTVEHQAAGQAAQDALAAALKDQADAAALAGDKLKDLGTIAVSTFAAAVAAGMPFADALKAAHPGLDRLRKDMADLGLTADDAAVKTLLFLDDHQKQIAALGSLGSGLNALSNMGLLDEKTFQAMQRTGNNTINDLFNAGKSGGASDEDAWRQALLGSQDFLHQAQREADARHELLDPGLQGKIEESKALGIWKDQLKSDTDRLIDKLDDIIQTLNNLPLNNHGETTPGAPAGAPPNDFPTHGGPQVETTFATEAFVRRPTLAMVGDVPGGEFVLKPSTVSAWMNASYGAGAALARQATSSGWWNPPGANAGAGDRGGTVTVHEEGDTYHVSFEVHALDAADLRDAVEKPGGIADLFIENIGRRKRGRDIQLRRAVGPT